MATTQDIHAPTLGAQGEPCAGCGAPLAADQRYCLECGARRAQARIAFREILARPGGPPRAPVVPSYPAERTPPSGIAFLVGLVCLLLALGVGVLIGRSGNDSPTAAATTPPPQVFSVGGAAPAATTPAATTSTPAATTSTPTSGKSKTSSGSSSGSKSSKATNKSLKDLSNSSGQDYEKKSSKLPKQVSTGGKAPPKDNKPAGGGTDFQDIG
jgi:hypothetical protein